MVGERLTELRIKNNMTQEEFAEYMCVTRQSVSKWETDKTYPDVEKLIKIAELYNVSLDYLVRGQEPDIENDSSTYVPNSINDVTIENHESLDFSQEFDIDSNHSSSEITKHKKNKLGLKLCVGIATIFIAFSLAIIVMCLVQNPWFHSDITEQSAKVEKVYGQISIAQVTYKNQDGDELTEFVVLDTANVRQGDYINTYTNESGDLFIDYGAGVLSVIIVFLCLNIFVVFLLVKELTNS